MARRKAVKPVGKPAEPDEAGFLVAIQKQPDDRTARVAYADWLDEHDRPYEAAVQRDKAGVSEVWYMLRRKTDGLFANRHRDGGIVWSATGKRWRSLKELVPHINNMSRRGGYAGTTKYEDLEVVVIEIRPLDVALLPVSLHYPYPQYPSIVRFRVDEPVTPSIPAESGGEAPPSQPEKRTARNRRR